MKPGSPEKYDYEYVRNGTANYGGRVQSRKKGDSGNQEKNNEGFCIIHEDSRYRKIF